MQGALVGLLATLTAISIVTSGGPPPALQAGAQAPGGLQPPQVPQFVLLTHDDGVSGRVLETLKNITDGRSSAYGCPAVATLFAT